MRPIFEKPARGTTICAVQQVTVVGAEPREQRHVVRPYEHIDRVDLEETEARNHLAKMSRRDRLGTVLGESLRSQRDPPGLQHRQPDHGRSSNLLRTAYMTASIRDFI